MFDPVGVYAPKVGLVQLAAIPSSSLLQEALPVFGAFLQKPDGISLVLQILCQGFSNCSWKGNGEYKGLLTVTCRLLVGADWPEGVQLTNTR